MKDILIIMVDTPDDKIMSSKKGVSIVNVYPKEQTIESYLFSIKPPLYIKYTTRFCLIGDKSHFSDYDITILKRKLNDYNVKLIQSSNLVATVQNLSNPVLQYLPKHNKPVLTFLKMEIKGHVYYYFYSHKHVLNRNDLPPQYRIEECDKYMYKFNRSDYIVVSNGKMFFELIVNNLYSEEDFKAISVAVKEAGKHLSKVMKEMRTSFIEAVEITT